MALPSRKDDVVERAAFRKLEGELSAFIDEFAGTSLDYDPAIEAASLEAIRHASDRNEE
jgi:hypothetical protein